ncbi:MAG: peptidyl-prolyl cis-trans isomerase-like 1, partial [Candidatus Peregrinibacteria bacterium Greene0416_62]
YGKMLTGKFIVVLSTSEGDITVEIDADAAPKTATNFIVLAQSGYYDQLTFHRVIPGFMIQGGDPNGNGTGGNSVYGETFEDETDDANALMAIGYKAGVIAMANRGPDTNGSQFFIMDANYDLPPNYTIFGHVTAGQKVVNAIARVEKSSNDMPVEPVTFSVEVR